MADETPTPDDPADAELVAYLDGELDAAAARKIEAKLTADPNLRARAVALKKTFDLLDFLPKPELSATFTTRTLDKIPAIKSASVSALHTSTVSATQLPALPPTPQPTSGKWWVAGIAAAALLAGAVGYFATAFLRPHLFPSPQSADNIPLADLRVIERLRVYAVADDLDFVAKLSEAEYFGEDPAVVYEGPSPPASFDPADKPTGKELDSLVKAFKSLPLERQAAVRQLDQQLNEKPALVQDRLYRVLEAYAAWLERLPDAERRSVLAAATPGLRLDAIRQLRESQWVETLPQAQRKQLNGLTSAQRAKQISEWRDDTASSRAMWSFARRHWDANRTPWPFDDETRKKEVLEFVRNTYRTDERPRCRLTLSEQEQLRRTQEAGDWLWYGKAVYDLSKKYEMLPEPATGKPLTDIADLWTSAKTHYERPGQRKQLQPVVGKWPEFALAIHDDIAARKFGPVNNSAYGPCRPTDFKDTLKQFVGELEKKVKPDEWKSLKSQEGKWPDYPRALVKLATAYDLSVPGVTLPGPPSQWEKIYNPPRPTTPKAKE